MSDFDVATAMAGAFHRTLAAQFQELCPREGHCIEIAKIVRVTLGRLGVKADMLPCGVLVANAEAYRLWSRGVPLGEWPDSAWSIGVDPDGQHPGSGWNGHMLLAGDGWIADYSALQFDRPVMPMKAWVSPTPPEWDRRTSFEVTNGGNVVVIVPRPELARWRSSSAWRQPVTEWEIKRLLDAVELNEARR